MSKENDFYIVDEYTLTYKHFFEEKKIKIRTNKYSNLITHTFDYHIFKKEEDAIKYINNILNERISTINKKIDYLSELKKTYNDKIKKNEKTTRTSKGVS